MSKKVCEAINEIDKLFNVEKDGNELFINYNETLDAYCPIDKNLEKNKCHSDYHIVSSAFIALLTLFNNLDNDDD
ncbi:Plasmodium variant antigen protein Cir/Yir/Bir, putative, partial [Plasmodium chabaudi adami]